MEYIYIAIGILISLTIHESAHALTASLLGDQTAKNEGRVSLNPIRHLDLMGTLAFLITQTIGWGKPVKVNPNNFKNPIQDNALVAIAGPLSNIILAMILTIPQRYMDISALPEQINYIILYTFNISIFLAIFNLLPFPPLDGSKIIGLIIPPRFYRQYIKYLEEGAKYSIAIFLFDILILQNLTGFSLLSFVLINLKDATTWILQLGS